jgi:uncharacterized membrane protein YhaH (DUF805 family)
MSHQEIVDAWNRRPISNRVGSRRFRRRLVVATYGGWLVVAVIVKVISETSHSFPVLFVVLIANSVVMFVWFARRTYLSREVLASDAGLDERLVQNRNQAFRRAFQVFALVVIIAGPLAGAALASQPGSHGIIDGSLIYFGIILLAVTLPTAMWAWREPDPEP